LLENLFGHRSANYRLQRHAASVSGQRSDVKWSGQWRVVHLLPNR
jgi:hypothetical protein